MLRWFSAQLTRKQLLRALPLAAALGGLLWWWHCLPEPLFQKPYSTVLNSRNGQLMSAYIATDEQWRFPPPDSLPAAFVRALRCYEDRRFFRHPGVDPLALGRAAWQNLKAGRVVSGGSTLSMQVIRLARGNPDRTLWEKLLEVLRALRLELRYSKKEILRLYAAHAPFGGNVVGLEAAAWRYFGRNPFQLSQAELATLAVLPNAPALIHPGRNSGALRRKRNRLLERMAQRGLFPKENLPLAKAEALPGSPKALPQQASHLLQHLRQSGQAGKRIRSTLDQKLQNQAKRVLGYFRPHFRANRIGNAAALILDIETGQTLAYVGNSAPKDDPGNAHAVDMVRARRSTGSLLKPLLYAMALEEGHIQPESFLQDIPTQMGSFAPKNFSKKYDGLVPADQALSRSLNVPFVRLLQDFGQARFHHRIQHWGVELPRPPSYYGLSLILGGAESSLWELSGMYASLARCLKRANQEPGPPKAPLVHPPNCRFAPSEKRYTPEEWPLNPGSIYLTLRAMKQLERPGSEGAWQQMHGKPSVAWKTGTSFGNRDAWSIGLNGRYAVGVWVGNANGEGRTGLTGTSYAAPVMFRLFDLLKSGEFEKPLDDLSKTKVCAVSGFKAGKACPKSKTEYLPKAKRRSLSCPYHRFFFLNKKGQRVHSGCPGFTERKKAAFLVLSPAEKAYYRPRHPEFRPLPTLSPHCQDPSEGTPLSLIYPSNGNTLYRPKGLSGKREPIIAKATHRRSNARLFWHLDDRYLRSTLGDHQLALEPQPGQHRLTIVDERGNSEKVNFRIAGDARAD